MEKEQKNSITSTVQTKPQKKEENPISEQEKQTKQKPAQTDKTQELVNLMQNYLHPQIPQEVKVLLEQGQNVNEVALVWKNMLLEQENNKLKTLLEKENQPIGEMMGQGGKPRPNPFVEGFMKALMQR